MTADLSALIARLEAAEVGSRELDMAVHKAATGENMGFATPDASRCLDAALALAKRALPPMPWTVSRFHRDRAVEYQAALWMDPEGDPAGKGRGSTPTLALCIAILKAKQGDHP